VKVELTKLQKTERRALGGDKHAIAEVVSALRQYRDACQILALEFKRVHLAEYKTPIEHALIRFSNAVEDIETGEP
jgi:hypothetical protein